jgi:hypothetical protein
MSESTRKKIIYVALVAAIIYGANHFLGSSARKSGSPTVNLTPAAARLEAKRPGPATDEIDLASLPWGSDPFHRRGGSAPTAAAPDFQVTGIVFSPVNPLAYVNGTAVRVGDDIDGARVLAIEKKAVKLEYRGREMTITISRG